MKNSDPKLELIQPLNPHHETPVSRTGTSGSHSSTSTPSHTVPGTASLGTRWNTGRNPGTGRDMTTELYLLATSNFLKAVMPQYLQFGLNFGFFINFLSLAFTFFTSSDIKYRHMINRASQRWLVIEVATTKHFGGAGARVYPTLSEILMQASKNTAHFLLTWPEGISPCPIPAIPIPRSLYAWATLCFTRKSLAKRLESEP